jgi:putative ABC transport system ATP-binding protein
MIRFDGVTKTFGHGATEVQALRDVSLAVAAGRFCAVTGPSGSGKSTLLHLVAGLTHPTAGEIHLAGRALSALGEEEWACLRRREIGFVFQFFHLIPYLDAEENVALPLLLDGRSLADVRERTAHALSLVDLAHRRHHRPSELSGGEMQRVAIARALVTRPRVVLADEPTGNLDSNASHGVMRLLRRGADELGVTVLMVTHDPVCASYGDRIVRLVDGRIVEDIDVSEPSDTAPVDLRLPRAR